MLKKANIPFGVDVNIGPDRTGLSATFQASYRLQGTTGAFTTVSGTFSEIKTGTYQIMVNIPVVGYYDLHIASTEPGIDAVTVPVIVGKAAVDDVFDAIAAAQLDISAIKGQVDTLDEAKVNAVKDGVDATLTLLTEVKALMSDVDDPAIISLKELLLEIQASGTAENGLITALQGMTNTIKTILMGQDEFLADGITPNPHYQASNVELSALISTSTEYLKTSLDSAKDAIMADALAKHDLVITRLTGVRTVVDANAAMLANAGFGLAALKSALDTITTNTAGGTQNIIDVLENAESGLDALKAAITSVHTAVTTVDGKVSAIAADVTELVARDTSRSSVMVLI